MLKQIFFWGFALDATIVLVVSGYAAGMYLLGKEMKDFIERVIPATFILVGGSIAAALIMWAAEKFFT